MVPNWGHAPLIGSSKTHKPIRGSQIVYMTSEAWVSGSEPFRYLLKDPIKFHSLTQGVISLA